MERQAGIANETRRESDNAQKRRFCGLLMGPAWALKMSETTLAIPKQPTETTVWSELVFLTQVSRPGLWSTTAMFYLMPLGHGASVRSWKFCLGLFFILIPLGL